MAQPEGKASATIATNRATRMPIGQLPPSLSPVVYIVHDEVARQKLLRHQPPSATASAVAAEGRQKAGSSTPAVPMASVIGNGSGSSSTSKSRSSTPNLAVHTTSSSSVSTAAAAVAATSSVATNAAVLLGVTSNLSAPISSGTVVVATARSASTPPVTPLSSAAAAASSPAGSGSSSSGGGGASAAGGGSCTGAGRYQCVHCGRSCAKPSVLEKHLRAHTGERPYPCQPCGFSFKTKSNLYKHRKSRSHLQRVGAALPHAASTPTGATSVAVSRSLRNRAAPAAATEDDGSGECGGAVVDELSSTGAIDDEVDECCVDYFDDVDDVDAAGNGSGNGGGGGGGGEEESLSNSSTLSCSTVSCGSVHRTPDDKEDRDYGGVSTVGEEEPPAKRPALWASGDATGTTAGVAVMAATRSRDQAFDVRNVQAAASSGCDVPGDLSASSLPLLDATTSSHSVMQATDSSGSMHANISSSSAPSLLVAVEPLRLRTVVSRTSSFAQSLEDDADADAALPRSADSPALVPALSSLPSPTVQPRQQQQQFLQTRSGESRVPVTADKVALRERIQHLIDTNSLIMSTPLAEVQRFKRVSRLPSLNGLPTDEPSIAVVGLASSSASSASVPQQQQQQQQQQLVDSIYSSIALGTQTKAACPLILVPVTPGMNDLAGVRLISDVTAAAAAPTVRHVSPMPSVIAHQLSSPALPESRAGAADASSVCVADAVAGDVRLEHSELASLSDGGRAAAAARSTQEQQQQQQQKTCTVGGGGTESGGQSCSASATRPAAVLQQCSQAPAGQPTSALAARDRDGRCTPESRGEQLPVHIGASVGCSSGRMSVVPAATIASAKPLAAAHQLLASAVKLEPGTLVQVVLPPPALQSSSVPASASAVPAPSAQLASQLVLCKADATGRQVGGLSHVATSAAVLTSAQLQRLHHASAIHIEVSTKETPGIGKPLEPGDRGMKRALSDAGSPRPKLAHTFHQVEGAKLAGLVPRPSVRRQLSEVRDSGSGGGGGSSTNSNHGGDTGRLAASSSSVHPHVVLHDEQAAVRPREEPGACQSTVAVSSAVKHSAASSLASDIGAASAAMVVASSGGRLMAGASGVPAVIAAATVPASSASSLSSSSHVVAVGKSERSTVYGSPPILLFAPSTSSTGQLVQQNQELPCSSSDTAVSLSVPGLIKAAHDSGITKCAAGQAAIASGGHRESPIPVVGTSSIGSSSSSNSACDSGGFPTTTAVGGNSTSSSVPGSVTWKEQLRGRILQRRSMSTEHGGGGSLPSPAINGGSTAVAAVDFSFNQPQPLLSSITSSSQASSAEIDAKTVAGKSGNSACDSAVKAVVTAGTAAVSAVPTGLTREATDSAATRSVSSTSAAVGLPAATDSATIVELATRRPTDRMWQPSLFVASERTSLPAESRPLSLPATSVVFVAAASQGSSGVVTAAANPATFAGRLVRFGVLPHVSASATTAPSPVWPFVPVDTSRPCSMPLVAVAPHCMWPAAAAPLQGLAPAGRPVRLEFPAAAAVMSSAGVLPSIFFASPVSGMAGAPRGNSAATPVLLLSEKAANAVVASSHRDDTVLESGRTAASCEPSAIVGPATWLSSAAFRQDLMKAGAGHISTVADPGIHVAPIDGRPADAAQSGRSAGLTIHVKSATIDGSCAVASAPVRDDGRGLQLQSSSSTSFSNGDAACTPIVEVRDANCSAETAASAGAKRRATLTANDSGQWGVATTMCKAADIEEPSQKRKKPDSAVQPNEAEESVGMAASTVLRAEPRPDCAAFAQPPPAVAHGKVTSPAPQVLSVASTSLPSFFKLAVPCTSSMLLSTLARPDQRTVYRVMLQPVTRSLPTGRSDPSGIKSSCGESSSQAGVVVAGTAASGSYKLDAKLSTAPAVGPDGCAKIMDDRVATAVARELTQPAPTTSTRWCLHRPQPSASALAGARAQPCSACVRECATAVAASTAAASASAASHSPTPIVPLHCTLIPSVQCLAPVQAAGQRRPEIVYATSRGDVRSIITHSSYWSYQSKLRLVGDSAPSPTGANRPKLSVSEAVTTAGCSVPGKLDQDTERLSLAAQLSGQRELHLLHHQGEQLPAASSKALKGLVRSLSTPETGDDGEKRVKIFVGGFKSEEEYTYIRGRGRGKYVCERCGIRCKKPSMLKKHIRTHTDLRPYSCKHCEFSFKTKGNLTKHMRSKAHHKRCLELGIVPVPTNVDDSQIDAVALAQQQEISRESRIKGEDDFEDDLQIVMEGDYDDDDDEEDDNDDEDDEEDDEDTDDDDADQPDARASDDLGRPATSSRDTGNRLLAAVGRTVKDPAAGADRRRDADVLPSSGQRESRSKSRTNIAIDESADSMSQQYVKDASHVAVKHEYGVADRGRSGGLHGRPSTASAVRGQSSAATTAARESIDNEVARSLLDLSKMPVPCRTAAQHQKQLQSPQSSVRQLSSDSSASNPSPGAATDGNNTPSKDGGSQRATRGGRGGENRFETFVGVALTMNKQNTPKATSNTSPKPEAAAVLLVQPHLQSAPPAATPQPPDGGSLTIANESGASLATARLPAAGSSSAAAAAASPANEWCQVCEVHLLPHTDPNEHRRSRLHMDKLEERGHLLAPLVCQPLATAAALTSMAAGIAKAVALQSADCSSVSSVHCHGSGGGSTESDVCDVAVAPMTERDDSQVRHWRRQRAATAAAAGSGSAATVVVPADPAAEGGGACSAAAAAAAADGATSGSRRFRHPPHSNQQHQAAVPATKLPTPDFSCPQPGCGKQCSNKDSLKSHIETHIDSTAHDRPGTKCDVCEKKFKSISGLKQHLVTHAQLRPYVCEYCDAGFTAAQSLKFHLRTHTQERPYICTHCGDTFARSDHLKQHTKRHMRNQEPPDTPDVTPATSTHKPSLTRDTNVSSSFVPPSNLKAHPPDLSAETLIHSKPISGITYTPVAETSARQVNSMRKKDSSDSCVTDQSSLPAAKPTHLRTNTSAHTLGSHSNAFAGKEG